MDRYLHVFADRCPMLHAMSFQHPPVNLLITGGCPRACSHRGHGLNRKLWRNTVFPCFSMLFCFFPRASERRVLPIVGVCISSSHLLIFTPSHLHTLSHIFSSSHLLIFTSAHLHIFSSSHLLIFTPSHLHIFSSSHLLIFISAHLHICSSSHLLIFISSHLHICSSSHLHILTPSLSLSLSHSHSHLHTFTYSLSHSLLIPHSFLSLSPLSSLLSLSLSSFLSPFSLSFLSPFSLSRLLYLSLFRPRVVPAGSHETWTLSHEMRVDRQKLR